MARRERGGRGGGSTPQDPVQDRGVFVPGAPALRFGEGEAQTPDQGDPGDPPRRPPLGPHLQAS